MAVILIFFCLTVGLFFFIASGLPFKQVGCPLSQSAEKKKPF
jgi:hypothetical protein